MMKGVPRDQAVAVVQLQHNRKLDLAQRKKWREMPPL
jgi:hypothetical protein